MVPEFYNRLATMDLNKKRKTMMPEKFASIFSEENPLTDHGNTESTHADSTPPVLSDKKGSDFLPSQAKGILKKKRERRKIQTDVSSDIDLSRGFLIMDDPGSRYHRFQEVDHAGHAILSLEDKEHLPHVLIKERRGNKSIPYSLKGASHENVVGLLAAFYHSGVVSLVYECHYVNMTVASVSGCSEFKETDIATVCREALQGLEYIHSELRVAHGSVNDKNIILTLSGDVKIANIGDSMLNEMTLRDRDQDLKAVGKIAMNLQDRSTKLEQLDVEHWTSKTASDSIRQFIKHTGEQTTSGLLKHDFLSIGGPSWTLKPYIMAALKFDSTSRRAMGFKD